jgi:molybdate transport system regulatory protein
MQGAPMLRLKIQLYCGDEIAMGPGKADLLEAIRVAGSISGAARAMSMSYRRAWLLVDAMNRCWQEPLVETSPGSAHGGGARVSAFGDQVLTRYRALQASVDTAAAGPDFAALEATILAIPRTSQKT